MSKNIVFEGWLTKSPPSKRIWKTKWRRRWFALRQSGELPGQYFLDYYADRNRRRLKGSINLDFCEQVDAGLHMERGCTDPIDPKLRGSVFTIQTQTRIYHLEADCEADMVKWVDAICCVCGLKPTEDNSDSSGIYQNHNAAKSNRENIELRDIKQNGPRVVNTRTASTNTSWPDINEPENAITPMSNEQQQPLLPSENNAATQTDEENVTVQSTGPYIPISECITGVRSQDTQNASTVDSKNTVVNNKPQFIKPEIRVNNVVISDNESNFSDDEYKYLNTSRSSTGAVPKTFKKLSLASKKSKPPSEEGPPVPPRPPKTFAMSRELFKQTKVVEAEVHESATPNQRPRAASSTPQSITQPPPGRSARNNSSFRITDDEDDAPVGHTPNQRSRATSSTLQSITQPPPGRSARNNSSFRITDDEDDAPVGHTPYPSSRAACCTPQSTTPPSSGRSAWNNCSFRTTDCKEDAATLYPWSRVTCCTPQCTIQPYPSRSPWKSCSYWTMDCEDDAPLGHTPYPSSRAACCTSQSTTPPSSGRSAWNNCSFRTTDCREDAATPYPSSRAACCSPQSTTPPSPGRSAWNNCSFRTADKKDDASVAHGMQYSNLTSIPPLIDRALKPRIFNQTSEEISLSEERRQETLQYLDLDFDTPSDSSNKSYIIHGKSNSSEDEPDYKMVDFVKTEAFNSTLRDAEALRNQQ